MLRDFFIFQSQFLKKGTSAERLFRFPIIGSAPNYVGTRGLRQHKFAQGFLISPLQGLARSLTTLYCTSPLPILLKSDSWPAMFCRWLSKWCAWTCHPQQANGHFSHLPYMAGIPKCIRLTMFNAVHHGSTHPCRTRNLHPVILIRAQDQDI